MTDPVLLERPADHVAVVRINRPDARNALNMEVRRLIADHLAQAYCGFGEPPAQAERHAQARIEAIITAAERLATAPFRGESRDDLLPGLRHLALDRAVYWFRPRPEQRDIQVLAVFFGGQDHQRRGRQ